MAIFPVNTSAFRPCKSYRIPGLLRPEHDAGRGGEQGERAQALVRRLPRTSEGGNNIILKGLGRTKYEPITLERGITQDNDFIAWADAVQKLDQGHPTTSLANLRREIRIQLLNEEGQPVHGYIVHRCWVSEFQALPDLDAGATAVAVEHIRARERRLGGRSDDPESEVET